MRVTTTDQPLVDIAADTIVVPIADGEPAAPPVAALLETGEARTKRGHLALLRDDDRRTLVVGIGDAATCDRRALYEVATVTVARLRELGSRHACWLLPTAIDGRLAASALIEGTTLAAYRYRTFKSAADEDAGQLETVTIAGPDDLDAVERRAVAVASAVNRARDLQNGPSNVVTPGFLAERAHEIAAVSPSVTCETGSSERIAELGMGAFAAVTQGSETPPALIMLRYEGPGTGPDDPLTALVGKGVTFDSGGLSIKPANSMVAMKSDMTGAAAVIEATAAIAELGLPVRLLTIVGATENTINGHALKPGDVLTAGNGLTIEIDNTDAEGRLVLADCLHHAVSLGADRLIDLATLTGAMKVALGSEYCGYFTTGDGFAAEIERAAQAAGESVWRMPLDDRYGEPMKGKVADLTNAAIGKGGGACTAAAFLRRFTGEAPWAHFDLSTAWDSGVPWAKKGGSGTMVATLVALAEQAA